MNRSRLLVVAPAVACLVALAGCSGSPAAEPAASPSATSSDSQQVLAPIVMTPDDLDGQEVTITPLVPLVLSVETGAEADWQASVADPAVVLFSPGEVAENSTANPAFFAATNGSTQITLDGPDAQQVTFTLTVTDDSTQVVYPSE